MNNLALSFVSAIIIGLGATLTFDLWALFLKHAFNITPSNICLVGRWLRYMPEGTFSVYWTAGIHCRFQAFYGKALWNKPTCDERNGQE
jgi:hypothetical protein